MKVQTEEAIINELTTQIKRLEAVLADAKLVLQRKQKTAAAAVSATSPIIYRRVRLQLENGSPDNLNCLTFAFRINYAANVLQAGWSLATDDNVDLELGRVLSAERLHLDPLEVTYRADISLVDNVYLHFYGELPQTRWGGTSGSHGDVTAGLILKGSLNNAVFNDLKRKLRSMQSKLASEEADREEAERDAVMAAIVRQLI